MLRSDVWKSESYRNTPLAWTLQRGLMDISKKLIRVCVWQISAETIRLWLSFLKSALGVSVQRSRSMGFPELRSDDERLSRHWTLPVWSGFSFSLWWVCLFNLPTWPDWRLRHCVKENARVNLTLKRDQRGERQNGAANADLETVWSVHTSFLHKSQRLESDTVLEKWLDADDRIQKLQEGYVLLKKAHRNESAGEVWQTLMDSIAKGTGRGGRRYVGDHKMRGKSSKCCVCTT